MDETFTLQSLRNWGNPAPLQLAVLGDPVAHSASPPMHMAALKFCGLPHLYGRLHIRPEELPECMDHLRRTGFLGVNLTIPHKTSVIPLADHIDAHAAVMGAVNTVVFRDQQSTGFNTDGKGLLRAISESFDATLGELRVMVLGAGGGAGRAVALQCAMEGCPSITLVNRSVEKTVALAEEIKGLSREGFQCPKVAVLAASEPSLGDYAAETDIILQCSSLGMEEGDASPIAFKFLRPSHLVYETIYSRHTKLLEDARSVGARTANGLGMLLHQGALAFEIWFQRPAPLEQMRTGLLRHRGSPKS